MSDSRWSVSRAARLQDGFLFSGTVRENLLGPRAELESGGVSDATLWETLRRVGAAPVVSSLTGGLDGSLGEQGGSLSAGERALLCLARAILRLEQRQACQQRSATLVLADEPTSSVDLRADATVHDVLLALPQTVLCICHRLHHVPRFDLVAVFADGVCAEIGPPATLSAAPGSLYARLVASASHQDAQ